MSDLVSGTAARAVPLRAPSTSPAPAPAVAPQRWLRLVPQRRSSASRAPFAVVLVGVLGGGLLGLLLLNTLVAQDSFTLHRLATESRELQQREQMLASQLEAQQAPSALAGRATDLGMVPGGAPVFLRLSDGRVLGKPTAGKAMADPVTEPVTKPVTDPAAAAPASKPSPVATSTAAATPRAPESSTTWTAPRQTPPPTTAGARR
jgi:hypothetical protein